MEASLTNRQMKKFGWYGLLKNLKFFEPYLLLYLIFSGLSFFEIGILYAIRESMIYIFEIPSGVFADRFGKKTELLICFLFYIASFVGFFFATNFIWFILPFVLYGLGEAFRSGTHKAMIMGYLDHHGITTEKRQVYGYTRSYSNIGSTISSIFGVILVLYVPDLSILFLIAIIPYILDFILVFSYPNYLNQRIDTTFSLRKFMMDGVLSVRYAFRKGPLRTHIFNAASFQALFKTLKDYVQPLMYTAGITLILFSAQTLDQNIKMYIGITYAVAQFISVFVTKNAYRLRQYTSTNTILFLSWLATATIILVLGAFPTSTFLIVLTLIVLYIVLNIRKPYLVQRVGDNTEPDKRASVLSIESQLTSLMIIVFAPIAGWISDAFGINVMLLVLGSMIFAVILLSTMFRKKNS